MKCMLCNQEVKEKPDVFDYKVGKIPEFKTTEDALKDILRIANDKRSHIMFTDAIEWERVKMKYVKKIVKSLLVKNGD